jgi:poly[(R)-3-hydroxyalkanoate] polymerase subunit PhaE
MKQPDASPEPNPASAEMPSLFGEMQPFADMWQRSNQMFLENQRKWFGALTKATLDYGEGAVRPETAAFEAAKEAYLAALGKAMSLSSKLIKSFQEVQGGGGEAQTSFFPSLDPQAWRPSAPHVEGVARLQEGPQLADIGQTERMFAAAYSAMAMVRQRSLEHQMLMTNAWSRAAGKFMTSLNTGDDSAKAPTRSSRDLSARWIQIANDELIATQRTDEYLTSQRNLLKAFTDLRLANQDLTTFYSEMFDLPTRAEMDDVHKTLTALRREVRTLQRPRIASEDAHG